MTLNTNDRLTNIHAYYYGMRITWSAVIGGALVAFGLTFLFNLLALSIGLSGYSANYHDMRNISGGALILGLIGGFILLLIAGLVTGKLIRPCLNDHARAGDYSIGTNKASENPYTWTKEGDGLSAILHGFMAWALYLIISLFILAGITIADSRTLNRPVLNSSNYEYNNSSSNETNFNHKNNIANRTSKGNLLDNPNASDTARNRSDYNRAAIQHEKDINNAGESTIGIFLLFFLGALACCLGSYWAFSNKKYEKITD